MKTKFKLIFSVILCLALVMPVCNAESLDRFEITEDETQRKLTIYGTPEDVKKGEGITVEVLKKDMASSAISDTFTKDEIKENFIFIKQVPADSNGGYTLTVNMKDKTSGYYIVRVNGEDNEIYFSTNSDKDLVVDQIKATVVPLDGETDVQAKARAISEIATIFDLENPRSTTIKTFNITDEVVTMVTPVGFASVFYTMVDGLTIGNLVERTNLSAYMAALNEDLISVVDYDDVFGLEDEYVAAYEDNLTDTEKADFTNTYYAGKKLQTKVAIKDAFEKGVLTSWCSDFEGWADVEEFINDFGEDAGVDMEKFTSANFDTTKKSKLYVYLADIGKFSSVSDFAGKANSKIVELLSKKPVTEGGGLSGGTGGGGRGGSASAGAGAAAATPLVPVENVPDDPNTGSEETKSSFTDMEGYDWAVESVEALKEAGIVTGTGEDKYEPGREVSREEMLVMILRAFEVEIGEGASDFTDAAADGWYTSYLAAAKEKGFVSGKPDGTFGVGEAVTREDAAVMAYNIAKAMGFEFNTEAAEAFADDAEVSDYAKDGVYALKNAEVINGKGEGKFDPKATCTRAEAAKIIFTLISK